MAYLVAWSDRSGLQIVEYEGTDCPAAQLVTDLANIGCSIFLLLDMFAINLTTLLFGRKVVCFDAAQIAQKSIKMTKMTIITKYGPNGNQKMIKNGPKIIRKTKSGPKTDQKVDPKIYKANIHQSAFKMYKYEFVKVDGKPDLLCWLWWKESFTPPPDVEGDDDEVNKPLFDVDKALLSFRRNFALLFWNQTYEEREKCTKCILLQPLLHTAFCGTTGYKMP